MHSIFSYDGQMSLEGMVKKGLELGLLYLAFTEHVEFGQITIKQFLNRYKVYEEEVNRLQETYPKITLLKGAEVSNPEIYTSELGILNSLDLDYIIGSNHQTPKSESETDILNYYKSILNMVKAGGIDSVGHLDYLRRKFDDSSISDDILKEIFEEMIKNGITLEINSSAIRRKNLDSFPSHEKINLYTESGGMNVTLGSDAHRINEIYDGIQKISKKYSSLNQGIYIKRKFKVLHKKRLIPLDKSST